jgi:hypothetical protein
MTMALFLENTGTLLKNRVADPDKHGFALFFGSRIRIRIRMKNRIKIRLKVNIQKLVEVQNIVPWRAVDGRRRSDRDAQNEALEGVYTNGRRFPTL